MFTIFFMMITALVLAEVCSALPLSGSIYIWAAESAGAKYARFFGFVVAWWSCTAWMTFIAGNCQVCLVVPKVPVAHHGSSDDRKLRRVPVCGLGNRLSRWDRH